MQHIYIGCIIGKRTNRTRHLILFIRFASTLKCSCFPGEWSCSLSSSCWSNRALEAAWARATGEAPALCLQDVPLPCGQWQQPLPKHVTLNALPRLFPSRRNPATSYFWRLLHFPLALPIQPVARLARLCALSHCQQRTTQTTSVIHPPGHSQGGEPWPVPCSGGGVTVDSISCVWRWKQVGNLSHGQLQYFDQKEMMLRSSSGTPSPPSPSQFMQAIFITLPVGDK